MSYIVAVRLELDRVQSNKFHPGKKATPEPSRCLDANVREAFERNALNVTNQYMLPIKYNRLTNFSFFLSGPKSDVPKRDEQCPPYFEDITTKMEERRCDLIGRHKHLREKITTMERSIPALMAYNMWMAKKCDDAPYCKVRQIMKKFSPYPDQTERLLGDLKKTVKDLNGETEELHVRND